MNRTVYLLTAEGYQVCCRVRVPASSAWRMNDAAARIAEDTTGLRVDFVTA